MLRDAWILAVETIDQVELLKLNERLALNRAAKQTGINNLDAIRIAYKLVVETERRLNVIDKLIDNVIKPKRAVDLSLSVQSFLRLYVYQTRLAKDWTEPDLEEATRIAKLGRSFLGWKTLRPIEPFLGLLLSRSMEPILKAAIDEERIALQTYHPTWFVKYCFGLFGRSEAIAFLEGNIFSPPTFIRVNTLKGAEKEILSKLNDEGVKLEKEPLLKHIYKVLSVKGSLSNLTAYKEGLFYVQGKASCFVAEIADPKPGMTVLDVCAAPGAKTTYLAQIMQSQGKIISVDFSARRLLAWEKETKRMGVNIAEPIMADARSDLPLNVEADVVLLDPPCTSTGDFGRQPSAKWRLTSKSAETMAEIQYQMINSCAEKVKECGSLIYATCSITLEENEMVVERFLKQHPEFSLAEITTKIGSPGLRGLVKTMRLYPHLHECNGYYVAKLRKD